MANKKVKPVINLLALEKSLDGQVEKNKTTRPISAMFDFLEQAGFEIVFAQTRPGFHCGAVIGHTPDGSVRAAVFSPDLDTQETEAWSLATVFGPALQNMVARRP